MIGWTHAMIRYMYVSMKMEIENCNLMNEWMNEWMNEQVDSRQGWRKKDIHLYAHALSIRTFCTYRICRCSFITRQISSFLVIDLYLAYDACIRFIRQPVPLRKLCLFHAPISSLLKNGSITYWPWETVLGSTHTGTFSGWKSSAGSNNPLDTL